jgi:hypothetical protein
VFQAMAHLQAAWHAQAQLLHGQRHAGLQRQAYVSNNRQVRRRSALAAATAPVTTPGTGKQQWAVRTEQRVATTITLLVLDSQRMPFCSHSAGPNIHAAGTGAG